jgi:murein DD-endopeptidase MepM/ murein hydrolase activator NlpD
MEPDLVELGHTIMVGALVAATTLGAGISPATASAAPGFACTSTSNTYTVRSGDSWYGIARRASVSGPELLAANGVTADQVILPGDVVCLPGGADGGSSCGGGRYTVVSGDSWYAVASRAGISGRALLDANGATAARTIAPGDELCLPAGATMPASGSGGSVGSPGGGTYTVVAGDSWYAIARRAGVSARSLLETNDATSSTLLVPGAVVHLPAGATTPSPAPASAGSYTVRGGDSWFAIATRADVSVGSLVDVNGATTRTVLVPGRRISLPAGADADALANGSSGGWVNLDVQPTQGPCWYGDTWMDARSEGRRHEGVDIFTVPGQYVYAVVDGRLSSRIWNQPGLRSGNAWWLTAADGSATFFYAHLLDFAPGLRAGSRVQAGQIIGFVGDTGNAAAVHLHFEIHPGGGDAVNPYPMVKAVGGCRWGTPYEQPGGWTPERVS